MKEITEDKDVVTKGPWYFYILLFCLPFVFFVLIEVGLRVFGYGASYPLFVESYNSHQKHYLHVNPNVIARYFSSPTKAPNVRPDIMLFAKDKPRDVFRIFIQGGSTAAGFPYGRNASLQALLNQQFKTRYPEKKIEIISTAMAAVNSYTLLDFVDEIIAQAPDLVVIYAGHNEFLGVMGVGSQFSSFGARFTTRLVTFLRRLRIYQFLERTYSKTQGASAASEESRRTLMSQAVKEPNIPYSSPIYERGVRQFEKNMDAILKIYAAKNIPVVIGNLVANEKDQPPFSSVLSQDWHSVKQGVLSGKSPYTVSDLEKRLVDADLSPTHAANYYTLGLAQLNIAKTKAARKNFIRAKDADALRFRAPSEFNELIAQLAKRHGATLVDVEQEFVKDSADGIIGRSHMLEHLHPNKRGYFILGKSYAQTIIKEGLMSVPATKHSDISMAEALPITKLDELEAQYTVAKLINDYPFVSEPSVQASPETTSIEGAALSRKASQQDWFSFNQQLISQYINVGDLKEAAKLASNMSDVIFYDAQAASQAAKLYKSLQNYYMAIYYLKRAHRLAPTDSRFLMGLSEMYFYLGDKEKSKAYLLRAQ